MKKALTLILAPFGWGWKRFKHLTWRKKLVVVGVGVVGGVMIMSRYMGKGEADGYEMARVERGSVTEYVSETGHVTSAGAVPVYSTTTGLVDEVRVNNGDYVERDTVLFKVKSTATRQEKDAALANYLAAKTALETAEATQFSLQANMLAAWDRFKELAESDEYEDADGKPKTEQRDLPEFHIPEKEWLAAEANYKKQATALSQARAQASSTWRAYQATQDSEVRAVLGGEVRNLGVTRGDSVLAANVNTATTTPALVLVSPGMGVSIKVMVSESDVVKIAEGQEVTVELDAVANREFRGRVDRVDTLTVPAGGVVEYGVYVLLEGPEDIIRAGMTADVNIKVAEKKDVLVVPSSAVKPHEGGRAVRMLGDNGEIEFVKVSTGSRGDGIVEIVDGVSEGEEIIVALGNEQVDRKGMSFF